MKIISSLILSLLFLNLLQCNQSSRVATIDHKSITRSDIYSQHFLSDYTIEPTSYLQQKYLNQIILRKLLYFASIKKNLQDDPKHQRLYELSKSSFNYYFLQYYHESLTKYIPLNFLSEQFENADTSKYSFKWKNPKTLSFEYFLPSITKDFITRNVNYDSLHQIQKYREIITVVIGSDTIVQTLNKKNIKKYRKEFLREFNQTNPYKTTRQDILKEFKFKLAVPLTTLDSQIVRNEYKKNPHQFKTKPSFRTFYIESSTKKRLEKIRKNISNLEDFKGKIKQLKIPNQGVLGFVKEGNTLPYGIGFMPQIFSYFRPLKEKTSDFIVTKPIQNIKTKKWYLFAANDYQAKQLKPLERVYKKIENRLLKQNQTTDLDQTIAHYKGGTITERDYQTYLNTFSVSERKKAKRNFLIKELVLFRISYARIRNLGFDQFQIYKYSIEEITEKYWGQLYLKKNFIEAYGFTHQELENIFSENPKVFITKKISSFDKVNPKDLILFTLIPKQVFEIEYHTKLENYGLSKKKKSSFQKTLPKIFFRIKKDYEHLLEKRLIKHLSTLFPVQIIDTSLNRQSIPNLIELGLKDMKTGEFDKAIAYYKKAQHFTLYQNLQDSISFLLARAYLHDEQHYNAMVEHRRLIYLFPASRFNCNSQFMSSYIRADYYKKNKKAIQGFKTLISKYPDCPLIPDAKFMIKELSKSQKK